MSRKLIVSIVPNGKGDAIASAATRAGAGGGTLLRGRGTAPSTILHLLGFGEKAKQIALIVVPDAKYGKVKDAILAAAAETKRCIGVLFTIEVGTFEKSGERDINHSKGVEEMNATGKSQLIAIIVNQGLAEDAMAAARKAGARGGTILDGTGTAKEDDATFFGVSLVPEKEILLIHVEADKADAVYEAVRSLPCFKEKGVGIVFRMPVEDFASLGD